MKKLKLITTLLGICVLMFTACHSGPHTVIIFSRDNQDVKVEYGGRLDFDHNYTRIVNMSDNGYIKYKADGNEFYAENTRNRGIVYEVNDGQKTTVPNEQGRRLLAEVVRIIARQQGKIK